MTFDQYQTKSVTPIDDYECKLSPDLLEILENELRETEEARNYGIKALRDWTMQNPRIIQTRLDSSWLLKHLRFKKYSIPAAQEAIERHLVLRQGFYGNEYFHNETDVLRPCVKKIFDIGFFCLLPERDEFGRPTMLFRVRNLTPGSSPCLFQDCCTAMKILSESLGEIEEFQIRGVNYILDVSGLTPAYLKIMPIENLIKICKNAEKCVTGRHKSFHIVNVPPALSYLVNLFLAYVPQKIKDRLKFHKSFDELSFVDKKSLPKEYGGEVSMAEMGKPLWDLVLKNRDLHMSYQRMKVNEKMYPKAVFEGSLEMLKIPLNTDNLFEEAKRCGVDALCGMQGSFRKLEID